MAINYADLKTKGLLVHACCGPCATYPTEELLEQGVKPLLYYYNPNIHPQKEWQRRYLSLRQLAKLRELLLIYDESYREAEWLAKGPGPERCLFCYQERLEHTAEKARDLGLKYFTTSLLISPYQNREAIVAAGEAAAEKYGRLFWAADWREHFRQGQNEARDLGLYRQKYCGCIYSLRDSKFYDKIISAQAAFELPEDCPQLRVASGNFASANKVE